jgi:precorrin-2/cobalt-factor-2 C20-methyltransferase
MTGKLYVTGVGPGDPELLTLKALRILREVPCICVPKGREEGSSLALSIVRKAVNIEGKEIIEAHFPMRKTRGCQLSAVSSQQDFELDAKWDETARDVLSRLDKGIDVAFITLGDPTIYSTFFYLYDRLVESNPNLEMEIIPGVSSITAASAQAKISLGLANEKIAILPANYIENLKESLEIFDTIVLMKVHKVYGKVLNILDEIGLTRNAVYVSRSGMDDEKIFKDIRKIKEGDLNYFSVMIIKK